MTEPPVPSRSDDVDYTSLRTTARRGLWHRQTELTELEKSASAIRHFLPAIPTGLLQIREYARQMLTPTVEGEPVHDIERVLRGRMARHAILDDESRRFTFLMTEQAVRWRCVADEIMVQQLNHMAEVARKPSVEIAIIPQSITISHAPLNIFVIYDEHLVQVEIFSGLVSLRDPRDISYHLNLFEFFLGHALTGDDAIDLLQAVASEFM